MEEELSDKEVEHQMNSILYYGNVTQNNTTADSNKKDGVQIDILPRSNVYRYWHTNVDNYTPYRKLSQTHAASDSIYQKINTQTHQAKNKPQEFHPLKTKFQDLDQSKAKPHESLQSLNSSTVNHEVNRSPKLKNPSENADLSILQQPVPNNLKTSVEILDNDHDANIIDLQSSDEDEVIEVALPPKPTITIESSDDEVCAVPIISPVKGKNIKQHENKVTSDRAVSSSPVPSIVSSVSDEFIRSDCIALNISSRSPNNKSFDFSLHGNDLLGQTPSKKKKKKKSKENTTSTPIQNQAASLNTNINESFFATPKSKAKKKKKSKPVKSSIVIPPDDVNDSDSNQSLIETNKKQNAYIVTEKSLPSTDVYESDSNNSEQQIEHKKVDEISSTRTESVESSVSEKPLSDVTPAEDYISIIDHSYFGDSTTCQPAIDENIVMANVSGFTEDTPDETLYHSSLDNTTKLGSTNIPAILCEDLDFDNLKGKAQFCKRRRYSLTTLRAEMEKFYNESWGGENFNHREIQKNMSRDEHLWVIDPKDRLQPAKRKVICNYCNRPGHRDDACHTKPPVCYMCGSTGHYEPRCPRKICVNCGSPNHIYSNTCRNCSSWRYIRCAECGQGGHPASNCPDLWRRYHNTIDFTMALEENRQTKRNQQLYCSGCTRRGHLVHTCRVSLPFSGLPINSPYIISYRNIYPFTSNDNININKHHYRNTPEVIISSNSQKSDRNKRQSKSPVVHETHQPKRRSICSESSDGRYIKSPHNTNKNTQIQSIAKNNSELGKTIEEETIELIDDNSRTISSNHDNKGHIIQDNEISDTSEVITSARIYLTNELKEVLNTDEGKSWLNDAKEKNHVTIESNDFNSPFLNIKGSVGNQEAFQSELREWTKTKKLTDVNVDYKKCKVAKSNDIPKNKRALLRKLNTALNSLKKFLGDPSFLYKELMYHQNRRGTILNQKVISSAALLNNSDNIKAMQKKLNMVLLGQAGLAGGMQHLHQLYMLQEKITQVRQKTVSQSLRDEVGKHFHCIFSGIPRDDYADLVQKYNLIKTSSTAYKKKNKNTFKVRPKPNTGVAQTVNVFQKNKDIVDAEITDQIVPKGGNVMRFYNKLIFCHRRLLHTRPVDSKIQKRRQELDEKLRSGIATLGKLNSMSQKTKKRMKKIQDEAQSFLASI